MRDMAKFICGYAFLILIIQVPAAFAGPLDDRVEAVVIKGADLPTDLIGGPISSYRLFASNGSELSAIPMQIDERDSDGEFLWQVGPEAGRADNNFDANDELVFMAFDSGVAHTGETYEGCKMNVTLTVSDKKTAAEGQVVLARCDNPPPLSEKVYANADYGKNMITGKNYKIGWENDIYYSYDYLSMGDGPDFIDRLKVRITMGKFGLKYVINEEDDLKTEHQGYIAGPVRVLVKTKSMVTAGPFKLYFRAPMTIACYRDYIHIIGGLELNFNPAKLGLDFSIQISHDMTLDKLPGKKKVCTNNMCECRDYDDKISPEKKKKLAEMDTVWGGFEGPDGTLISYFVGDNRLSTKTHGIYVDDPEMEHPPESFKGENPLIGFDVVEWDNVKPEFYNLEFYHFFMPKYSTAEVDRYARLVNQPLKVSVK